MDINEFLGHIKNTLNNGNKYLEDAKSTTINPVGLVKNTGLDALQLALGIPQSVLGAVDLQKQYGTPNKLAVTDPVKYAQILSQPIKGYGEHLLSYTPIPDAIQGNIQNYPERITEKLYKNPTTTTLDMMGLLELATRLQPDYRSQIEGSMMKRTKFN